MLFPQFILLQPGMQFDLVHGGHHLCTLQQPVKVLRLEVGDADGPDLALAVQRLQGPVGFREQATRAHGQWIRYRSTYSRPRLDHRRVEGPQGGVVAVVVIPDLGGDERIWLASAGNSSPEPPLPSVAELGADALANARSHCRTWRRCQSAVAGTEGHGHESGRVRRRHFVQAQKPSWSISTPLFRLSRGEVLITRPVSDSPSRGRTGPAGSAYLE
jgi:hypothetical protein